MRSATDALRKLNIVQRKCLFNDESISQLPVYSYNACLLVCRAQAALKLCNCRPYYYPFMNGTSCSPAGLLCLEINKWPQSVGTCGCSKACVEIVYTQNSLKKINWWVFGDDICKWTCNDISGLLMEAFHSHRSRHSATRFSHQGCAYDATCSSAMMTCWYHLAESRRSFSATTSGECRKCASSWSNRPFNTFMANSTRHRKRFTSKRFALLAYKLFTWMNQINGSIEKKARS